MSISDKIRLNLYMDLTQLAMTQQIISTILFFQYFFANHLSGKEYNFDNVSPPAQGMIVNL